MKKGLLLLALLLPCLIHSQATLDIGIFNQPAGSNQLEIRLIPTQTLSNAVYSAGVFTIRFPASYGVSLVAPTGLNTPLYNYNIANQGTSGAYKYYSFSFVSPYTVNWTAGTAYTVAILHIVSGSSAGTGTFEIVNDAWTAANNGDLYQELNGNAVQGIFYQPSATAPLIPGPPDTVPPDIACTANKTVNTSPNACAYTHVGSAWNAVGNDNYPGFTITYFFSGASSGMATTLENAVFNLGLTHVTAVIKDGANLTDTCFFNVTVVDQQQPNITAPPALTVSANAPSCTAANVTLGTPVTTDNCSVPQISNNAPTHFPLGNTVVIWTATDAAGLTATATQVITVQTSLGVSAMNLTNTIICYGGTSTLSFTLSGGVSPYQITYNINGSATTAGAYLSNQPIVVAPLETTGYLLVQVSDAIGCSISPTGLSRTLIVKPRPTLTGITVAATPVCVGEPVSVLATGLLPDVPTIFQYTLNGAAAMQTVTSSSTGTAQLLGVPFPGGNYTFHITTVTVTGCQAPFSTSTSFVVDSASEACKLSILGTIKTEAGHPVKNVMLGLHGTEIDSATFNLSTVSDTAGRYQFLHAVPYAADIELVPYKNDNHLNGVTTFDLVLISKHILGLQTLDSPYKIIAADANHSGLVTTADIVELRKMILGITDELPANTSWRFLPSGFTFPDPQQPLASPFPEQLVLNHFTDNLENAHFTAIKTGDVNASVITGLQPPLSEERSLQTLFFDVSGVSEQQELNPGEIIKLFVRPTFHSLGYQFTLETEGLEIMGVIPENDMRIEHFGLFDQTVTVSYFSEMDSENVPGFYILCKVKTQGTLQDKMHISSRITPAEAYLKQEGGMATTTDIQLRFAQNAWGQEEWNSVWPNPFSSSITIETRLKSPETLYITASDETGKAVLHTSFDVPQGGQRVALDTSFLPAGIFMFKMQTSHNLVVKKLIKL